MPEVVVVPRSQGRELRSLTIGVHRNAIVPEQGVAEAHEGVQDVVIVAMRNDVAELKRGLPRVALEVELGEVAIRE